MKDDCKQGNEGVQGEISDGPDMACWELVT